MKLEKCGGTQKKEGWKMGYTKKEGWKMGYTKKGLENGVHKRKRVGNWVTAFSP